MKGIKRTPVPLPSQGARSKERDAASKIPLSQEFVDSDSDSSEEKSAPSKGREQRKENTARKSSSKIAKTATKSAEKKHDARTFPPKAVSPAKKNDSRHLPPEPASEDSSADDSSSESPSDAPVARASLHTSKPPAKSHAVAFQLVSTYVPPNGFRPVLVNDKTTSTRNTIFDSLQGKHIWHITAPADVSLKDLSNMAMGKALEGGAVLTSKGAEYGFSTAQRSVNGAQEVLVPRKDGYMAVTTPISQIMHLQTLTRPPSSGSKPDSQYTGSEALASITRSTIRAPRRQVKGLKMRFLPTGFGGDVVDAIGDSDSEIEATEEATGLMLSKGVKQDRSPEEINRGKVRRAKKEKTRAERD